MCTQLTLDIASVGQAGSAQALMDELVDRIEQFNAVWPSHVVSCVAYPIELYDAGLVPQQINPQRVSGTKAIALCQRSFRAFSRPRAQHPGSVYRMPGYIVLDRLLLDEIDTINALKTALADMIKKECPDARARNTYCRQHFPGRVMLQVYRHIRTARTPIKAVRFSWSPSTFATKKLDTKATRERLIRRLEAAVDPSGSKRQQALSIAIDKLRHLPKGMQVVEQKPRAPYPVATLFHSRGRNAIKSMEPLSLPVFIGPGVHGEACDVGELHAFDAQLRRRRRSDAIAVQALFTPLYLYLRTA